MRTIGNIIWLLVAGFEGFCSWITVGFILCLTIIGIPFGLQCFKIAMLSLWPFGRDVVYPGTSTMGCLGNLLWLIIGIPLALGHLVSAVALMITIIGIPFAGQSLKLARLSLMPFGAEIIYI